MIKHVFLLGVDGAGTFFRDTDTPNIDREFAHGAFTYDMLTSIPTVSAECWGSLLLGVGCEKHGKTNDSISNNETSDDFEYPTAFRVVHDSVPDAKLASFTNWNPINYGIIEHNLGVVFGTGEDDRIAGQIVDYLGKEKPTLLFAQFDSVDSAGHRNGYGSQFPDYLKQITLVDGLLGKVFEAIEGAGIADESLIMVIADHGGTPTRGHGGDSDAEKYVFFACRGGVPEGNIGKMHIMDVPYIICRALNIQPSEKWQGSLPEFFNK